MATYIDFTSEEEQAQSLAQFLQTARSKGKEPDTAFSDLCTKLIDEKNFVELWSKLSEESTILFADSIEKDVESFFAALASLLKRLGLESVNKVLPKLIGALTAVPDEKPLFRLKLLGNAYNILDINPAVRYQIFTKIFDYAVASKHQEVIVPHFKEIDSRIAEWKLDKKQHKDLFQKIRDVYKNSRKIQEAFKWSVKYLAIFENAKDPEAITEAVSLVKEAISLPQLYQMDDLLDIPAVKGLADSSTHSKIYQLFSIFVGETLDSFKAFVNANPSFLKESGLDEKECLRKITLLTLATLGASNKELSFAAVAKALHIGEGDVELWIITAISEGILAAKIDQMKNTVLITRSLQRVFTNVQWKYLSDNLTTWKKNVQLLAQTLHDCKLQAQQQGEELLKGDTHITQI